jgi:phosphoribosylpyrophosphate synthetase
MAKFFAMPGNEDLANALAVLIGSPAGSIETRRFPDGESYVRVDGISEERAFLVCTLARPDEQFLPLIYAARAMRFRGEGNHLGSAVCSVFAAGSAVQARRGCVVAHLRRAGQP